MAHWNGVYIKLVKGVIIVWFVVTNFAFTVEPKAMTTVAAGTTSTWFRVTSKALSSIVNKITGSFAKPQEELNGNMEEKLETVRQRMENFFSDVFQNNNSVTSGLQRGKAKLEEFRNSLPALDVDLDYIKEHISGWNWEAFSAKISPSTDETETKESENFGDAADLPPECSMTTPEMIRYAGYPCEVHTTTTEDGYILQLHRIPYSPKQTTSAYSDEFGGKKPVVFFQHGILADSSCWIANGPDRSLPFILSDAGCDVWLGNVRGSTYSRAHVTIDVSDEKFWRFTWQDMAEYDLPAMVGKALQVSGRGHLYYVGHSQGTLIAFAKLSEDPEFNKRVRMLFALGPVSTLGHITSPVKSLTFLSAIVRFGLSKFGGAEILPKSSISRLISAKLHKMHKSPNETLEKQVAYHGNNLMMFLCGVHPDHYYEDRLPVYFSHTPAGTSIHNLIHMSQLVETGKMQKWDYRSDKENMKIYGQEQPPDYDVTNIRTPVAMFVGTEDQLADPTDSKMLAAKLKTLVHYRLLDGWDHLDFLWGRSAANSIYQEVLEFIKGSELGQSPKKVDPGETKDEL